MNHRQTKTSTTNKPCILASNQNIIVFKTVTVPGVGRRENLNSTKKVGHFSIYQSYSQIIQTSFTQQSLDMF